MPARTVHEAAAVAIAGSVLAPNGCLIWTGRLDRYGYGRIAYEGNRWGKVHRAVYAAAHGEIPAWAVLDHVCHSTSDGCPGGRSCLHRACVAVEHLEAVEHAENGHRSIWARKTRCRNGHPYDQVNTYHHKGTRSCRICNRAAARKYKALRSAA